MIFTCVSLPSCPWAYISHAPFPFCAWLSVLLVLMFLFPLVYECVFQCSLPVFVCLPSSVWPVASNWLKEVSWILYLHSVFLWLLDPCSWAPLQKDSKPCCTQWWRAHFSTAIRRKCIKQSTLYLINSHIQSTHPSQTHIRSKPDLQLVYQALIRLTVLSRL